MKLKAFFIILLGALFAVSCSKDDKDPPAVTTSDDVWVSGGEYLVISGNVLHAGSGSIGARGIVYSASPDPVRGNVDVTEKAADVNDVGEFSVSIPLSSLKLNTTYYFRAYAQNGHGVTYGAQVTYKTDTHFPYMITLEPEQVTPISYTIGGQIEATGGEDITAHGLVYTNRTGNFDINSSHATVIDYGPTTSTEEFTETIENLQAGVKYYVKSFATNSKGTGYGEVKSFIPPSPLPTVEVVADEMVSSTSHSLTVTVHSGGSGNLTYVGMVYSTQPQPSRGQPGTFEITLGSEVKTYTKTIDGLTPFTKYYVRAYAENTNGMVYSAEYSFTAGLEKPMVTTKTPIAKTPDSYYAGGTVTAGNESATQRGVVYGPYSGITIDNPEATVVKAIGDNAAFTVEVNNLPGGVYYIRAFASNSKGTGYGEDERIVVPKLSTYQPVIRNLMLMLGGEIAYNENLTIIEKGVVLSKQPSPTVNSDQVIKVMSATATVNFTATLVPSTLDAGEKYYVRAFVNTPLGYVYGNEVEYVAEIIKPSVVTLPVTVDDGTYTLLGQINDADGTGITVHGFIISETEFPESDPKAIERANQHNGEAQFQHTLDIPLNPGIYYVRAYVNSHNGTSYGNLVQFIVQ